MAICLGLFTKVAGSVKETLPPLLFSLAFEPFLRSILQDSAFHGYTLRSLAPYVPLTTLAPVKFLAYAGDVIVFLQNISDLGRLHHLFETYSKASNAKLNYHKTQAISLSGMVPSPDWNTSLSRYDIQQRHDCRAPQALVYLGFPLVSSTLQRDTFLEKLLQKIKHACNIHRQRRLSVLGRATVLNTLIFSTLWHVLRVVPVPESFVRK
ncbi:hypothetical protein DFQ29_009697, partial [Apophysomyces sp. BC1021]